MEKVEERYEEESPFARLPFVASAVVLAAVLAGGVWLLVDGRESVQAGSGSTPPAVTAPSGSVPGPGTDPQASVCGMDAGQQGEPTGPLGMGVIEVAEDLTVPDVPGVGPGVTDGVTRCFAHSPTGAVVAAVNALRWISSNQRLDEVTSTLLAAGSDRDRMLAEVEQAWDGSTSTPVTVQGYKLEVRGDDEVVVTLAVTQPGVTTRPVAWPMVMVWEDGDWKVKAPSTSSWGQEPVSGTIEAAGFITWRV